MSTNGSPGIYIYTYNSLSVLDKTSGAQVAVRSCQVLFFFLSYFSSSSALSNDVTRPDIRR